MTAEHETILLLTRPERASVRFAAKVREAGIGPFRLIVSPLIGIDYNSGPVPIGNAGGLIFTSRNGVEAARKADISRTLPCWCVGASTASYARDCGWVVCASARDSDEFVHLVGSARPAMPLLHIRGRHTRGDVAARLNHAGIQTHEHVAYDQPALPFSEAAKVALSGQAPVIAPVFSPRTARHFAQAAPFSAPLWIAAISRAAANPLESLPSQALVVAKTPDAAGVLGELRQLFSLSARVERGPPGD